IAILLCKWLGSSMRDMPHHIGQDIGSIELFCSRYGDSSVTPFGQAGKGAVHAQALPFSRALFMGPAYFMSPRAKPCLTKL
ncbi:MAG: hypothetical protein ACYYK0_07470, partial [Candidatus Eutrophobiaceae bacterium]